MGFGSDDDAYWDRVDILMLYTQCVNVTIVITS